MSVSRLFLSAGLLGVGLFLAVSPAEAQDAVKVGPDVYKLVFENDQIRILDLHFAPGGKIGTHSHPDHFVYAISGDELTVSHADGKPTKMTPKAGEVVWKKAETHSAENTGKTDFKAVVVELKDKAAAPATQPAPAPAGPDAVKVSPETHKVLLDNDRVRVLEVRLKAGGKLARHSHPNHAVYGLADGKARFIAEDGKATETELKKGQAIWRPAETHTVENIGSGELHVLDMEFKPSGGAPAKP